MILPVQNYLQTNTFGKLIEDHGVYASVSKNKRKISLNYDQLEAKNSDTLAWDCRGLILAKKDFSEFLIDINGKLDLNVIIGDTQIVAFGMRRFFNYGQDPSIININLSDPNLAILEKLDGSLNINYFDKFTNEWNVATRSVPEADVPLDNGLYTFRTLFEKALKETNGMSFSEFTDKLDRNITYCFELTSPYNKIVVDYKNTSLTLIAARKVSNDSVSEIDIDYVDTFGIPHVQAHTFMSINDLVVWVSTKNPLEHEGVVVRDSNFNRIKVKNASYVAFHRARDVFGSSERNCLALLLSEHEDDVMAALPPEIIERINNIKKGVIEFIKFYDKMYIDFKREADETNPGDKKTFALLIIANKQIWSAPMFTMFDGKVADMKSFIAQNRKMPNSNVRLSGEGEWSDSFLDKILDIIKKFYTA